MKARWMIALLLFAAPAHARPRTVTDLRVGPAVETTIRLTWTTPATLAHGNGCRGDSLARSWHTALIYAQPRKSPWVPGPLWPMQVPFVVDSTGLMAPGSAASIAVPLRPEGDTYMIRSRGPGGLSCFSNPMAAWK
jgi:hypothetical protein